ncbi:hypothetical protein CIT31_15375 [Mesorhizobium wenxiniae]|uniref:Ester cyclase n=1 Tax=Mesorhizobium wenxiniae TaxID=2014805 RepID=A0A271KI55_9HYPH|nr:hypothetical protein CIT31_15375 [Mesorhizobium wenxiniae]
MCQRRQQGGHARPLSGTHTGVFHGVEPSGKCVSVGVIHIDRVENGIVVEHFGQLDGLGLMHQIGAF